MADDEAPIWSLEAAAEEAERLRRCLNDLVSITALPALSAGRETSEIVGTLLDALLRTLRLAFVVARVNDPMSGASHEMVRVAESWGEGVRAREISDAIDAAFGDAPQRWPS